MTANKFSNEDIIKALIEVNGLVSLAAKNLNCTAKTIYTRAKSTPAVQQAIDDCRDNLVDHAEQALRAAVADREPWAVALVLKTLGKKRGYVERQEVTGADGAGIDITVSWGGKEP